MTDLRALVGACFLLAVMGMVVVAPLGWWAVVLGFGEAFPAKIIKGQTVSGERQTGPEADSSTRHVRGDQVQDCGEAAVSQSSPSTC